MQTMRPLIFCLLFLLLAGCGGERAAVPEADVAEGETAVSSPTTSPATSDKAPTTAEEIIIPAAPTSAYNPDGFSGGSSRFISLNDPEVIPASAASWLADDDIVIGVVQNGEARAYPIRQMAFHHIANDTLGGEPYLVTY